MWSNSGMLEGIEPVEIFHQFLFLTVIQFNNITWRKLFGVIFYRFVYISCFYSIQLSNIPVKNNLSRRSIQSAQKSSDLWALCAQRMGNKCPSLGLSMPIPWSVDAHSLVPDCPLDGQDRPPVVSYI